MKKLLLLISLFTLSLSLKAQSFTSSNVVNFVVVPVGPAISWAAFQVQQREALVNTNVANMTLSNYIRSWFIQSIVNTEIQERNAGRAQLNAAFAASTNKLSILNAAGVATNLVSPVDLQ